jgi:2'-5' RNA ligase
MSHQKLFFIALLPPEEVSQFATEIKQHFADIYHSKAALKSPPHITLQPPFKWNLDNLSILKEKLHQFSQKQSPIPMTLNGFSAFKPRVIYIDVLKNQELINIYEQLNRFLAVNFNIVQEKGKDRGFSPHLTVAFRDLTKANFYQAWSEFKDKRIHFHFNISQLTLLIHYKNKWQIEQNFTFRNIVNSKKEKLN